MDRCCCGRISPWTEPVIINGRLHERLGDQDSFCGPVDAHTARDQQQEIERLQGFVAKVRDAVENIDPDVLPPDASVAVAAVKDALARSVKATGDD